MVFEVHESPILVILASSLEKSETYHTRVLDLSRQPRNIRITQINNRNRHLDRINCHSEANLKVKSGEAGREVVFVCYQILA